VFYDSVRPCAFLLRGAGSLHCESFVKKLYVLRLGFRKGEMAESDSSELEWVRGPMARPFLVSESIQRRSGFGANWVWVIGDFLPGWEVGGF
jgi:hypothetical protein